MSKSRPRAQLLVEVAGGSFRFDLEAPTVSIGSDSSCTLSFEDQELKPHHCVIQQEEGFEIFDLSLEDGLKVNGRIVGAAILCNGDQIEIGKLRLAFLQKNAGSAPTSGAADRSEAKAPATNAAAPKTSAADAARSSAPIPSFLEPEDTPAQSKQSETVGAPAALPTPAPGSAALPLLSRIAFWRRSATEESSAKAETAQAPKPAPAATVPAATIPAPPSGKGFAEEMVEAMKRTAAYVTSLVVHAMILIIFSLVHTKQRTEVIVPRIDAELASFDAIEKGPEPEEDEVPDIEVDEEVDEPEVVEVDVDFDREREPREADQIEPRDESSDEAEMGVFDGGGVKWESGGGSFASGGAMKLGGSGFHKYVRELRRSGLDIVFVIDSTGSMEKVLDSTRAQITQMIDILAAIVPRSRLGAVTYRDRGDEYLTRSVELTQHKYKVVNFLDDLKSGGGGDIPEAVYEGLQDAIEGLRWSPSAARLIIVLGDAPGHQETKGQMNKMVREFARDRGHVHAIYTPENPEDSRDDDPHAKNYFRKLAQTGRGGYARLEEKDAVLERVLEVAMGERHRGEVRKAMQEVRKSWRAKTYRRMIDSADARGIWGRLRTRRADATYLRELVAANHKRFIPAYLALIADDRVNRGNRWAAVVLLRRLLASSPTVPLSVQGMARILDPDGPPGKLHMLIRGLSTRLDRLGFPTRMEDLPGR